MKMLISLILLTSLNAQADCLDIARDFFKENGNRSDRRINVSGPKELLANSPFTTERGDFLNSYDVDTIVYFNTGSYHSGWFKEAVILAPETCEILNAYTVAAE